VAFLACFGLGLNLSRLQPGGMHGQPDIGSHSRRSTSRSSGPDDDLDPVLAQALQKYRVFLLKVEAQLLPFIHSKPLQKLEFPGLNSYQRLILHRMADLYNLDHAVDSKERSTIVLYKTDKTTL
jgi:R3H domain